MLPVALIVHITSNFLPSETSLFLVPEQRVRGRTSFWDHEPRQSGQVNDQSDHQPEMAQFEVTACERQRLAIHLLSLAAAGSFGDERGPYDTRRTNRTAKGRITDG